LVLTCPVRSWSRRVSDRWHLTIRRQRSYRQRARIVSRKRSFDDHGQVAAFHQYEFSRAQLGSALRDAGFAVTHWEALDPGTAMTETQLMAKVVDRLGGSPAPSPTSDPTAPEPTDRLASPGARGRLRRAVFAGDRPKGPVEHAIRWVATRAFGHIQLVVAVPA